MKYKFKNYLSLNDSKMIGQSLQIAKLNLNIKYNCYNYV